jgi:Na+-transporting NADH:ubiquinone oxidoreductase subunit C
LALVCSALVAGAAVGLRPYQEANRRIDQQKNILRAAGLYTPDTNVTNQFKAVMHRRLVDLASGKFIDHQDQASLKLSAKKILEPDQDLAGLYQVERFAPVYLVSKNGRFEQIILPVRGKGVWSTMYAYVALDADLQTIRGISFYEHGETPGLGGEIENRNWQAGWQGKRIYGPDGTVALRVVKSAAADDVAPNHRIDGISGATMTGNGVTELMRFWFGDHGFGPFLQRLRQQGGLNG